ncbi:unnamed protein product, partial [Vitis vinifera]
MLLLVLLHGGIDFIEISSGILISETSTTSEPSISQISFFDEIADSILTFKFFLEGTHVSMILNSFHYFALKVRDQVII